MVMNGFDTDFDGGNNVLAWYQACPRGDVCVLDFLADEKVVGRAVMMIRQHDHYPFATVLGIDATTEELGRLGPDGRRHRSLCAYQTGYTHQCAGLVRALVWRPRAPRLPPPQNDPVLAA